MKTLIGNTVFALLLCTAAIGQTPAICPAGWHIPSDLEWKILEGTADNYFSIDDPVWDQIGERGLDAGTNLKSTEGWYGGGNGIDLFDFSVICGGFYYYGNGWAGGPLLGTFYTSSYNGTGAGISPWL